MLAKKKLQRLENKRASSTPPKGANSLKLMTKPKAVSDSSPSAAEEDKVPSQQKPDRGSFPIVAIGASAGGLEAFEQFFRNMPPESGIAFILIPHLDPMRKTILPGLLQRYSKMPFVEAEERMEVKPNHVYVIPPNKDMSILNKRLFLLEPVVSKGIRHPVDFFFRSLAQDRGENAIGIVLSGTGTEGSLGLKAIKGEGGLVLVQDPKDAKYDGMPSSAITTGLVDDVLPASKMPERLLTYTRQTPRIPAAVKVEEKAKDPLQRMFTLISAQTGHDFSLYKRSTIMRRVERRMTLHQIGDIAEYVNYLQKNKQEIEILFNEILIRVTHFFRDKDAFEALKSKAFPIITKDKSYDRPVRIWVPGCSTGEEAYSLAIMLNEYSQGVGHNFKTQIFATDIDNSAIDIARVGQYADNMTVDVSPERLNRYFTKRGNTYKIKDEIREMVAFSVQNLAKDPPFSKLDLISCRNLLIYLETNLQKRIIPVLHYALKPGGVLFLGTSEHLGTAEHAFDVLDKKWKIFRARNVGSLTPVMLNMLRTDQLEPRMKHETASVQKSPEPPKVNELARNFLLDQYSPPAALVDEKGDILYIHGRTGKFLEPASGKATLNIIDMAREGLRLDLQTSLRRAIKEKKTVRTAPLRVKSNGGFEVIDLNVSYLTAPERLEGLIMVAFKPVPHTHIREKPVPKVRTDRKITARMDELEFELKSTRERLQSTIEELETSNEELKSTNEELQSSNEELQSTNEELESSKEELQSVNEELMTVNAEYQGKIDEMTQASDDMTNLVTSTRIATIFLDNDLRIKRFTPAMKNIFNLIESDVGRPIRDIVSKLDYPELVNDAQGVIRTLSSREKTVERGGRGWYLCRILPYRTMNNVIDGAVITFVDITGQKNAQERAEQSLAFNKGIIETVREPLLILDDSLKVISANKSFYRTFRVSASGTEGKPVYDLGNRQWDIPKLRELLEKILPQNSELNDYDVEHDFPGIGLRKMRLNARRITHGGAATETILLAIEDVTGK